MSIPLRYVGDGSISFEHHVVAGTEYNTSHVFNRIYTISKDDIIYVNPYDIIAVYNTPVNANIPSTNQGTLIRPGGATDITTGIYVVPLGTTEVTLTKDLVSKQFNSSSNVGFWFFGILILILLVLLYLQRRK